MPTIANIAAASSDFNILTDAIGFVDASLPGTDLGATLSDPAADLTVFAPTDAAFGDLASKLGFAGEPTDEAAVTSFLVGLGPELLRDVILYHVSPGQKTLEEINAQGTVITELAGATITPEGPVLNDLEPDLINPSVVMPDLAASNGIIQVVDKVLLPVDLPGNDAPTITGIVSASGGAFDSNGGDFDLLLNAVQAADLAGALDSETADFTVFAPNDAAFVGLAQTLGFHGEDEGAAFGYIVDALTLLGKGDPIPLLTEILTFHVSPSSLQASQILSGDPIATLQGGTLDVDGLQLVDADPGLPNPGLIATDIPASNGIVHVIDGVLQPIETSAVLRMPGTDLEIGGERRDFISTGRGNDFVDGNGGNDIIRLGRGDDVGIGGGGRDVIFAGRGDDLVLGEHGNDKIFAGRGNDTVDGGAGRDLIFGGRGKDTFIFKQGNDVDRIADFRDHQDKIDVSGFGITAFSEIEHAITGNAHRTALKIGDDKLVLIGTNRHDIDADDFIFADPGDALI
ncbi:MAG: fasciclin domain-containing protein [Pseudomonadota bacterium]